MDAKNRPCHADEITTQVEVIYVHCFLCVVRGEQREFVGRSPDRRPVTGEVWGTFKSVRVP